MAQRHLWIQAYMLPSSPPNNVLEPTAKYAVSPTTKGTISTNGDRPRRILIARPKALNHNDKIRLSLERAYPTEYKSILDQAYAAYYFTNPASRNLPELYELLESGFLDQGIEACGLHSWVIGRTK